MRIHILRSEKSPIDEQTLCLGRELLPLCSYNDRNANLDYHIGEIARACVKGPESAGAAKELCESFVRALSDDGTQAWQYQHLANTLFEIQPEIALDAFFAGSDNDGSPLVRMLVLNETDGPVNRVPQELLLAWAGKDLAIRFPWVAGEIRLTDKGADGKLSWTPIAVHLLENATDRTAVLRAFSQRIEPRSWSGSLADVLTPYLQPIRALLTHSDPMVREWALKREQRLNARIAEERRQEQQIDARFE